jgi:DeoR/GlpR family transcriptional regulator of sugar metabolism
MIGGRREQILSALAQRQFMRVEDIALLLDCSLTTARRELAVLAAAGQVKRTHGGAVPVAAAQPQRATQADPFAAAKGRIAVAAAALVADGDTIGLGGGSTTLAVARQLRGRRIGLVTNSVDIALDLITGTNSRVVLLGGLLSPISREVVGPEANEMLARIAIDTLFVSVEGISADEGTTTIGTLEAEVLRTMAAQARRVVVTADHRKVGRAALTRILPLSSISTLITDPYPSAALEAVKRAGVEVIEAE